MSACTHTCDQGRSCTCVPAATANSAGPKPQARAPLSCEAAGTCRNPGGECKGACQAVPRLVGNIDPGYVEPMLQWAWWERVMLGICLGIATLASAGLLAAAWRLWGAL